MHKNKNNSHYIYLFIHSWKNTCSKIFKGANSLNQLLCLIQVWKISIYKYVPPRVNDTSAWILYGFPPLGESVSFFYSLSFFLFSFFLLS
uniref:Uncharacterized protein n=1 Tax=Rhizophora mucronata TaxID=61149 RepID=A0A2P2NFJ4_RHIMU